MTSQGHSQKVGNHRVSLCPGSPCQLHLPMPPSQTARGHKQGQMAFIQSIYIRFFYIVQQGPVPTTAFSIDQIGRAHV